MLVLLDTTVFIDDTWPAGADTGFATAAIDLNTFDLTGLRFANLDILMSWGSGLTSTDPEFGAYLIPSCVDDLDLSAAIGEIGLGWNFPTFAPASVTPGDYYIQNGPGNAWGNSSPSANGSNSVTGLTLLDRYLYLIYGIDQTPNTGETLTARMIVSAV